MTLPAENLLSTRKIQGVSVERGVEALCSFASSMQYAVIELNTPFKNPLKFVFKYNIYQ